MAHGNVSGMRTDFGQVGYTAILEGGLSIWGEPENVNALVECKALRRRDAMAVCLRRLRAEQFKTEYQQFLKENGPLKMPAE